MSDGNLEAKIDSLIEGFELAKLERRRENILSKIDGVYNVGIALSSFIVGLLINQRGLLIGVAMGSLPFSLIGVVLSILFSYAIGIHAMIKNSIDYRILSWGLLITGLTYFLTFILILVNPQENMGYLFGFLWVFLGLILVPTIFVYLLDRRLSGLLGTEKTKFMSPKFKTRGTEIFTMTVYIFFLDLIISGSIGYSPFAF
jgi:hypothetical protein